MSNRTAMKRNTYGISENHTVSIPNRNRHGSNCSCNERGNCSCNERGSCSNCGNDTNSTNTTTNNTITNPTTSNTNTTNTTTSNTTTNLTNTTNPTNTNPTANNTLSPLYNLSSLPTHSLSTITSILHNRYIHNLPYTLASNILISINPYKPSIPFPLIKQNVTYVISGESGAGKTFLANEIISKCCDGHVIRDAFVVLEAFGNACTSSNCNSSRFGKIVRMDDRVVIDAFLLEESRVTHGECNFHIFYQVVNYYGWDVEGCDYMRSSGEVSSGKGSRGKGSRGSRRVGSGEGNDSRRVDKGSDSSGNDSRGSRRVDKGNNPTNTTTNPSTNPNHTTTTITKPTTNPSNPTTTANQYHTFTPTLNAINTLSLPLPTIKSTLHNILQLGKLHSPAQHTLISSLSSSLNLKIAELFTKQLRIKHEIIISQLDHAQFIKKRDRLARTLYRELFYGMVDTINEGLCGVRVFNWCSVIDIFGFECVERNGYEQFLINYANEKMQRCYLRELVVEREREYLREGIIDCREGMKGVVGRGEGVVGREGMVGSIDREGMVGSVSDRYNTYDRYNNDRYSNPTNNSTHNNPTHNNPTPNHTLNHLNPTPNNAPSITLSPHLQTPLTLNNNILHLIENKTGIINIIKDESKLKTDLITKIRSFNNTAIIKAHNDRLTLMHSIGEVTYDVGEFVRRNNYDLVDSYRREVDRMVDEIVNPVFVRCIKPNRSNRSVDEDSCSDDGCNEDSCSVDGRDNSSNINNIGNNANNNDNTINPTISTTTINTNPINTNPTTTINTNHTTVKYDKKYVKAQLLISGILNILQMSTYEKKIPLTVFNSLQCTQCNFKLRINHKKGRNYVYMNEEEYVRMNRCIDVMRCGVWRRVRAMARYVIWKHKLRTNEDIISNGSSVSSNEDIVSNSSNDSVSSGKDSNNILNTTYPTSPTSPTTNPSPIPTTIYTHPANPTTTTSPSSIPTATVERVNTMVIEYHTLSRSPIRSTPCKAPCTLQSCNTCTLLKTKYEIQSKALRAKNVLSEENRRMKKRVQELERKIKELERGIRDNERVKRSVLRMDESAEVENVNRVYVGVSRVGGEMESSCECCECGECDCEGKVDRVEGRVNDGIDRVEDRIDKVNDNTNTNGNTTTNPTNTTNHPITNRPTSPTTTNDNFCPSLAKKIYNLSLLIQMHIQSALFTTSSPTTRLHVLSLGNLSFIYVRKTGISDIYFYNEIKRRVLMYEDNVRVIGYVLSNVMEYNSFLCGMVEDVEDEDVCGLVYSTRYGDDNGCMVSLRDVFGNVKGSRGDDEGGSNERGEDRGNNERGDDGSSNKDRSSGRVTNPTSTDHYPTTNIDRYPITTTTPTIITNNLNFMLSLQFSITNHFINLIIFDLKHNINIFKSSFLFRRNKIHHLTTTLKRFYTLMVHLHFPSSTLHKIMNHLLQYINTEIFNKLLTNVREYERVKQLLRALLSMLTEIEYVEGMLNLKHLEESVALIESGSSARCFALSTGQIDCLVAAYYNSGVVVDESVRLRLCGFVMGRMARARAVYFVGDGVDQRVVDEIFKDVIR